METGGREEGKSEPDSLGGPLIMIVSMARDHCCAQRNLCSLSFQVPVTSLYLVLCGLEVGIIWLLDMDSAGVASPVFSIPHICLCNLPLCK